SHQDAAAFALDVPPTPLPMIRRALLLSLAIVLVFVVGFGLWSTFAPLESAAVATGIVEVQSHRKTIQHLQGGIGAAIPVRDGDAVGPGQPLLRLDDTKARTNYTAIEGQLRDAQARRARLLAERDGEDAVAFPASILAHAAEPS